MSEKPPTSEPQSSAYEHPAGPPTQNEADAASILEALRELPTEVEADPEVLVVTRGEATAVFNPTKTKAEIEAEQKAKNAADAESIKEAIASLHPEEGQATSESTRSEALETQEAAGAETASAKPSKFFGPPPIPKTATATEAAKDAKKVAGKKESGALWRGLKNIGGWIGGGIMTLFTAGYAIYNFIEGEFKPKKEEKKK